MGNVTNIENDIERIADAETMPVHLVDEDDLQITEEPTRTDTAQTKPGMRLMRASSGKIGWALLWLLGVPLPVLLVIYLIRGH